MVADKLDRNRLQQLLEERVLARDAIDASVELAAMSAVMTRVQQ